MYGDIRRGLIARNQLAERALRKQHFESNLFDEHGWNMLLNLFAALTENETVDRSELFRLAEVHDETGTRWLAHLVQDGQVAAFANGTDITLTTEAIGRMRSYLDGIQVRRDARI